MHLFVLLLLSLLLNSQLQAQCPSGSEQVKAQNAAYEKEILQLVNQERKKKKLPALTWNDKLAQAARYHASDMVKDDYFDHSSHNRKNGKLVKTCSFDKRISAFFGKNSTSAENIAWGQTKPKDVVKSWMDSPGHRKNILSKSYTLMGAGYQLDAQGSPYWVQTFAHK